ncbi:MAG: M6 family metalloprotease domain-containing protein [Chitinivibrionia bacterium]|nr:M6 family metalloprotease domain-containing protein [Chitinivibrionia bacterium]
MKNLFFPNKISIIIPIFIFFSLAQRVSGVSAYPYPIDIEQPDGSIITVKLRGDEWINWRTTLDDYTMLVNGDGELEYAILDEYGDLQLSGIRAKNERERTQEEIKFLQKLPRNLRFSDSQINVLRQISAIREDTQEEIKSAPIQGTIRVPVILVAFRDKQFTRTKAQFESLFNQISYTDNGRIPGSLNDYFYLNSYGKFDLQVDVFGPYTLPNPISYYDHNGNGGNGAGARMARAAVLAAIADGCSFANYPDPANGAYAIAAHIIFAGYGQEAGAAKNTAIWSHASSFQTITNNTKRMNRYSCTPELRNNSGSQITGIGVIAHELGHSVLGLPDFYDANYDTTGTAVDLDAWCLMATGNWNGRGDIPAFLSAEPRVTVGWAASTELESPQDVTLPDPNEVELGVVYRINTATKNEYFLLENRQRAGWEDGSIPASGMLIYHVDKAGVNWSLAKNEINNNASRRGIYVKQAGCEVANGCPATSRNPRSNDVFPRDIFDSFTDVSIPNSKSWAKANTNKPVTDIVRDEYARTVSFKFMGGEVVEPVVSVGNYKKFDGKNGILFEKSVVSDFAKIDVKTPENATVNIVIYDNLGNVVFETNGKSGEVFVWNLTNKTGRYVSNGAYLVLAEAKGKTSKKLYLYSAKIGVKR